MNDHLNRVNGKKLKKVFQGLALFTLLSYVTSAMADEVFIAYIDNAGEEQSLTIDANSSDADNALAAELILEGVNIIVTLDGKEDLEAIAAAVSAKAPDSVTATAVSNTILGIGALLGGRSIVRSAQAPVVDVPPVSTPPVTPVSPPPPPPPSPPPPSSSVVSPN